MLYIAGCETIISQREKARITDPTEIVELNPSVIYVHCLIQGAILGLAAPSLEHERTPVVIPVDGLQPEVDN
jgi:hypothetical protein